MNQVVLDWPADKATPPADPAARSGFQIGWDHAHHGLAPAADMLLDGTPLAQGWLAGKAVFGRRTLAHSHATRQWLALRTLAWQRGVAFDERQLTAQALAQLQVSQCPVGRTPLGGAAGSPHAAVIERLNPHVAYTNGNLAMLSQRAASAGDGVSVLQAVRNAHRAQADDDAVSGLDAAAWWRLAALRSFATPVPFHDAARLPLAVLPPRGVTLVNAPQRLQALLTLQFATPGWSARTRAVAALLPAHSLRHDFNLFVGAFAPRVLEAPQAGAALRLALQDAWLNDRVQRRWHHLLMSLGESATTTLLDSARAQLKASPSALRRASERWNQPASEQAGQSASGQPGSRARTSTEGQQSAGHVSGQRHQPPAPLRPAPAWQAAC